MTPAASVLDGMGLWFGVTQAATALNVVLLVGLGSVWARNYRRFRSKHTLGLTVFAMLMLTENGLALYFYLMDPTLSLWFPRIPEPHQFAIMLLRVLITAALIFLAWVTWD